MGQRVTILVCGEPARGDDAVAFAAVDGLPAGLARGVRTRRVGQLGPEDLLDAAGPILVVDAVRGPPAGTIVDLALADLRPPARPGWPHDAEPGAASSHSLPPVAAVAIATSLRGTVPEGRFVGVAGARFDIGEPLSPPVRAAVPKLTERLAGWIRSLDIGAVDPRPARHDAAGRRSVTRCA